MNENIKAEHKQLSIRVDALNNYINHYKPELKAIDLFLLEKQLKAMIEYRNTLELRASMQNIELNGAKGIGKYTPVG